MLVQINYYAMFREEAGCSREMVETENGDATVLFETLNSKYGFTMSRNYVRLAVNDAFVDWSTPLNNGDAVVFIPPVAGG